MPYYASTWQFNVGSQAFVPKAVNGVAGVQWRCIDLRADCTLATGYCLVWTDVAVSTPSGVFHIVDDADDVLSTPERNAVESALGITLPVGCTFREAIRQIMTTDATGQGNGKWNPVQRNIQTNLNEIHLGDLVDTFA